MKKIKFPAECKSDKKPKTYRNLYNQNAIDMSFYGPAPHNKKFHFFSTASTTLTPHVFPLSIHSFFTSLLSFTIQFTQSQIYILHK